MDNAHEDLTDVKLVQRLHDRHNLAYPLPPEIISNDGKVITSGSCGDTCGKTGANHEEEMRFIYENSGDAIFFTRTEGEIIAANPAACRMFGRTELEICACGREGLLDATDPRFLRGLEVRKKTGIFKGELNGLRKDGTRFPCEVTSIIFKDAAGNLRTSTTIRDISTRKEAEEALRKSEERHRAIVQTAMDGFWLSNMQGQLIEVNEAYCRMSGYSEAELLTMRISDLEDCESEPDVSARIKNIHTMGEQRFESRHRRKDGSTFEVEVSVKYKPDGGGQCVAFLRDITAQKITAEALNKSHELLYKLSEQVPGVIYQYRLFPDGRSCFPYASSGMNNIYEVTPAEVREDATPVFGRLHPEDYQHVADLIFESARTLNHFYCEFRVILPRQGLRWLYSDAVPELLEDNSVLWHGIIYDITELKLSQLKIQQLNETLEERIAERTLQLENTNRELAAHTKEIEQFTYIASHDLQEPLRTLTNFTQLIREEYGGTLNEEGNLYIDFIYNAAGRMRELVTGLVDYSILGKEIVPATVDCNKLVGQVMSDVQESIKLSNAKITIGHLPTITCYETEMRLLFQNLLANAIKFRRKDVIPEITISVEKMQNEWLFKVADNGIGIEEKNLEKVFVIFKRMNNRTEYAGAGIGLAHCKKIVELHAGKIWVESQPGEGSGFFFTIPY